jgi:hypothetical protein
MKRGDCPKSLLEIRRGVIKHNAAKLVGVYNQIIAMRESGVLLEDLLDYTLQLHKMKKHSK